MQRLTCDARLALIRPALFAFKTACVGGKRPFLPQGRGDTDFFCKGLSGFQQGGLHMGNVRPDDLPRQGKRLMPYCLLPIKNQQHALVMGISKRHTPSLSAMSYEYINHSLCRGFLKYAFQSRPAEGAAGSQGVQCPLRAEGKALPLECGCFISTIWWKHGLFLCFFWWQALRL